MVREIWGPGAILLMLGAPLLMSCGEKEPTISRRGLPTEQLSLVGDLCPTKLEFEVRGARTVRHRARKQLRRLKIASQEDPDAVVRTSFYPSEGGVGYENLTLRELVREQLKAVPEGLEGDPDSVACTKRLAQELRGLLKTD